jgi:hypothetical protein
MHKAVQTDTIANARGGQIPSILHEVTIPRSHITITTAAIVDKHWSHAWLAVWRIFKKHSWSELHSRRLELIWRNLLILR